MRLRYGRASGPVDDREWLDDLRDRDVNYRPEELRAPGWHHDRHRVRLPDEAPGAPEPDGSWEQARRLIETYEVPEPSIITGLYHADVPLRGRDILLEGRFYGLRFSMGVRITEIIDEVRDDRERVWGWTYETLQGHLERGRMTYEVIKHLDTGRVEFVTHGVSQGAPTLAPIVRLGWRVFGRPTQLRFYRMCGERMQRIVGDVVSGRRSLPQPIVVDGLVRAPSDAGRSGGLLAVHSRHPS